MLTYNQFLAKHPNKYKGLSAQQKRQRYNDYVRSSGGQTNNNSTGRTRNQRGRAPRASRNNRAVPPGFGSAQGALTRYLALYNDPFGRDTVGLPVFPSPPSAKVSSWIRSTFFAGTQGFGYVAGSPTAASDWAGWSVTGSAFAGTSVVLGPDTAGALNGVYSYSPTNLPFSRANFVEATGIRARCAMAAVRIRYVGTEQDRGGVVYPFIHPNHGSVSGYTVANLAGFEESYRSYPVSKEWITAVWTPIHRAEMDYGHTVIAPNHTNLEANGEASVCIIVSGCKPGAAFEVEIIQHHEFLGVGAAMTKTDNGVVASADSIIDQLQKPSVSLRGSTGARGGPRMRRLPFDIQPSDLRSAMSGAARVGLGLLVQRMREDL